MGDVSSYEIHVRPDGPGTLPQTTPPTPGTLWAILKSATACHVSDEEGIELLPVDPPVIEVVTDITPMLALCKVTRVNIEDPADFVQREEGLWETFGGRFRTDPEGVLEGQRRYREQTVPMFGEELNIAALDDIDLKPMPMIVERYRQSYYAIFEHQHPFRPPWKDAIHQAKWSKTVLDGLDVHASDTDSPFHMLEMWWWHAVSTFAVPALEAFLGV